MPRPASRGANAKNFKKRLLGQYETNSVGSVGVGSPSPLSAVNVGDDLSIIMRMELLKQEYQRTQSELNRLEQSQRSRKLSRSPR